MSRAILVAALTALLLVGCGGDSETAPRAVPSAGQAARDAGSGAYAAKADRICAEMIAESRRMGARFRKLTDVDVDALTLTTRELVKPAIPVLEDSARRLRALKPAAGLAFDSYVSLFDPIVSAVRERVEAGEAGDSTRAHELELVLIELSDLQRRLAREAGLETCDVDFIATFSSAGGPR